MTHEHYPSSREADKDPETLEREIHQTRAEMNETLDSIERKLTAGQLLDQCLKFFGTTGSEIGSSVGTGLKNNPVPMLLTATGIGWMIFGSDRSDDRSSSYPRHSDYEDQEGKFSKIGETLESGATAARGQIASSTATAKEGLNKATGALRDSATRTKDAVTGSFATTTEAAQRRARQTREGFNQMLEEQPLVLGFMGIAIGAAIGAALPRTQQEDRLVGEMRDKTMAKARDLAAESYEKGREVTKQGVESAVQKVSEKTGTDSTLHS